MPRTTKEIAHRMIFFAKSLKISANFFHPKAAAAYEFGRQMGSAKLAKINPNFSFTFEEVDDEKSPPLLKAEFADGSKWEIDTSTYTSSQLRNEFFERAADTEDKVDIVVPGEDEDGGAGKKGDKGGAKGKK